MTTLEWSETEHGYVSDRYLIARADAGLWSLESDSSAQPALVGGRSNHVWIHNSLGSARAAALHMEVVRVRHIKLIRHVTLSIVMFGCAVGFYLTMVASTAANRLEWFVLAGAALVAALSEGLDAFVLIVADGWDHRYEVPRLSIIDRFVSSLVVSTMWRRNPTVGTSLEQIRVRTLT